MNAARTVKTAFLWSAIERFGQMGLQLILGVALARLLTPHDFGLIGMLTVFFGIAMVLEDAGFGSALIQRRQVTDEDETSVFWLNIGSGFALTITLCAIASSVAEFFRQPALRLLLCVLSLQVLIQSFSLVQVALLARKLDFKTSAIVNIGAILFSGIFGIGFALAGCGVWSLVFQKLSSALFRTVGFWCLASWRPKGRFSWVAIRSLWAYSSNLLASGILDSIFSNIYSAIFGRLSNAQMVGQFTNANQLQQAGAAMSTSVIGNVMFPQFARYQEDKEELKAQFRRTVRILSSFHFPIMAALSYCAHSLITCFFTAKWEGSVPFLRILSFVGMLYPMHALHLSILKAQGRSDLHFRLEIIKIALMLVILTLTWRLGLIAITWGILVHSVMALGINGYYTRRLLSYNWQEQVGDLLPACAASAMSIMCAALLDQGIKSELWGQLFVQLFSTFATYVGMVFLFRNCLFRDLAATVKELFSQVCGRVNSI